MFNNMKNKIREKTGSELPKFSLGQIQQKVGLGRHSRQGSETSLSSIALEEEAPSLHSSPPPAPVPEDPPPSPVTPTLRQDSNELTLADGKSLTSKDLVRLAKREDEWRSRLEKRDAEWTKRLEKREGELMKLLDEKEREWRKQEQSLTEDLLRSTRELKDALKMAEESKRKMVQYQEDKDQLEGFQIQELAKIKHLLLQKEQENAENANGLKEVNAMLESMKQEVNRLRPFEEQVSNFQAVTKSENIDLAEKVVDAEKRCLEHLAENERLIEELNNDMERNKELLNGSLDHSEIDFVEQLTAIKEEMRIVKQKNEELEKIVQMHQKERDEALLRNAQVSSEMEIARQQLRVQQQESDDLYKRLSDQLSDKSQELQRFRAEKTKEEETNSLNIEQKLQATIVDLEVQLNDKNKMVRVLQQRLNDMKKTLQRELKTSDPGGGGEVNHMTNTNNNTNATLCDDDVNFKYLKHVLIKFLTSREYEAQHLTRAVATLLKFSPEEERLLRDTIDWKMSWFGSRPRLPKSKALPHS